MNYINFLAPFAMLLSPIGLLAVSALGPQELDPHLLSEPHIESLFLTNVESPKSNVSNDFVQFTPPAGWHFAEAASLPASVKTLVIGKGGFEFPPSINLGMEVYPGTLKQYLKRVKEINDAQGHRWKDLGKIRTQAGDASLSQADKQTQWGEVKMMHVILQKNGIIYILTAAALKEEFPKFYKDFFNSFCSIRFS